MAFVGRTRVVARLLAAMEEAACGHARLVLVSGVAGIGKTTVVGTATARSGLAVGWGTCVDADSAPAFWPWTAALRGLLATLDPGEIAALAAPDTGELARLLPELAGDGFPAEPPDTDAARLRLFDTVARFLERLARRRPAIVVLDDLQWADASSLDLLGFVAQPYRPVPLVVVGAYRHDELHADAARAMAGPVARSELIELVGLRADEVHDLVVDAAGPAAAQRWAAEVHRRTDGHPFYARQLAELLAEPGAQLGEIPPAVRDLVLRAAVIGELTRAKGLGGRPRALGSSTTERARKAVTARLRDAIGRIRTVLPELGAHLDRSVITGTLCRYEPDAPLNWSLHRAPME